jgi:hypothetical protein
VTLHEGGSLQAERSLPKALRGENVTDLVAGEEVEALAAVDREIADALPVAELPPFSTWLPNRVDYCQNVHLRDEAQVVRVLEKLAQVELPRKGLPVRGEQHSVAWAHGAVRPKVYSKFLETKGDPRACGVLRFESGVIRARSFRDLLTRLADGERYSLSTSPPPVLVRSSSASLNVTAPPVFPVRGLPAVTLADVLTPAMHGAVLGQYVDYLRGDLMSQKELSDLEFTRELVLFFGAVRAAKLMGWCALFYVEGVRTRADLLASGVAAPATRYRVAGDMRRFRGYLRTKGIVEGADLLDDERGFDELLSRVGGIGRAA